MLTILNGVMAFILRYATEFGNFGASEVKWLKSVTKM